MLLSNAGPVAGQSRAVREYLRALEETIQQKPIAPHVTVWDKTARQDDTLSSSEFDWNPQANEYRCPAGKALRSEWRPFKNWRTHITKAETIIYRSSQLDCTGCSMKDRCCPNTPVRKIVRSVYDAAREEATRVSQGYEQNWVISNPLQV